MSARLVEHESEPVPGLPERLPAGEAMLWQGAPRWQALARRAFLAPALAAYFGVLLAWRAATALSEGTGIGAALFLPLVGALAALGLVSLYAWLVARTTLYTITSRRVVMRFGVALPMTVNIPFSIIEAARMAESRDGTGDIALALSGQERIAYLALWPHVRRWRYARPEPLLRGIPQAASVGRLLGQALAGQPVTALAADAEHTRSPALGGGQASPA